LKIKIRKIKRSKFINLKGMFKMIYRRAEKCKGKVVVERRKKK